MLAPTVFLVVFCAASFTLLLGVVIGLIGALISVVQAGQPMPWQRIRFYAALIFLSSSIFFTLFFITLITVILYAFQRL